MSSSANKVNFTNDNSESYYETRITDQRDVMGELPDGLQVSPDDLVQLYGDRGTINQGSLSEVL